METLVHGPRLWVILWFRGTCDYNHPSRCHGLALTLDN